jgi:imidazolonepropionase-like amidohydrolase
MPILEPKTRGGLWSRRQLLAASAGLPTLALASESPPWEGLGGFVDTHASNFTISNATVLDHHGRILEGAGVRVERARIVEVGGQVSGGIDFGGDWLVPGFTDASSRLGLAEIGAEKSTVDQSDKPAVTPDARAVDGYNPLSAPIAVTRVAGITHSVVCPTMGRLVPGQAALIRTAGRTLEEAVLRSPVALCVSMARPTEGDQAPSTRIGTSRMLRELIHNAPEPRPLEVEGPRWRQAKASSKSSDDLSPADTLLQQVRERRLKVLVHADRADDIERALAWIDESKIDGVLLGCAEGWMVADLIADAALPVVLGPLMVQPDSFAHPHARYDNAAILHRAGVQIALGSRSNHTSRDLRTDTGVLVAHGLPWEAAIEALTVGAANAYSIPSLGRMEAGGRASFFRCSGDPLQPRSRVKAVWIGGRVCSMKTRQSELYERFKEL